MRCWRWGSLVQLPEVEEDAEESKRHCKPLEPSSVSSKASAMLSKGGRGVRLSREEVTLDLLGTAAGSLPARGSELDCNSSVEFLELDPNQPLPSDWEKCLDLKTGEIYFVNKSTGVRMSENPRKLQQGVVAMTTSTVDWVPTVSPLAHEFLGSKRSETHLSNV